jgi:hypothetical protein
MPGASQNYTIFLLGSLYPDGFFSFEKYLSNGVKGRGRTKGNNTFCKNGIHQRCLSTLKVTAICYFA